MSTFIQCLIFIFCVYYTKPRIEGGLKMIHLYGSSFFLITISRFIAQFNVILQNIKNYFTMTDYVKKIILATGILLSGAIIYYFNQEPTVTITSETVAVSHQPPPIIPTITIHIAGAVYQPGVYDLNIGTRTLEALSVAGGITPDANLDKVNLAKQVKDGQRIYVPFQATTSSAQLPMAKIPLNSASAAMLQRIPGIGPALATEIVTYRTTHGSFKQFNNLLNVKYIGAKMLEKIKPYVTLNP